MELRVDALGRILLPKKLREKYGLKPKTLVRPVDLDGNLALVPYSPGPALRETGAGALVITGDAKYDVVELIDQMREERMRQVLGIEE